MLLIKGKITLKCKLKLPGAFNREKIYAYFEKNKSLRNQNLHF
jgi:hypothetical protein